MNTESQSKEAVSKSESRREAMKGILVERNPDCPSGIDLLQFGVNPTVLPEPQQKLMKEHFKVCQRCNDSVTGYQDREEFRRKNPNRYRYPY